MERCKHGMIREYCSLCRGMDQSECGRTGMPAWYRSDAQLATNAYYMAKRGRVCSRAIKSGKDNSKHELVWHDQYGTVR